VAQPKEEFHCAASARSLNGQIEPLPDLDQGFGQRVDQAVII
jgi:hypothetical protein